MDSCAAKSNPALVKTLAQLDIGGQSQGAINKLPNEILRIILTKLRAHRLVPLRSVSKKWKAVIEDICRDKKCLMIVQRRDKNYLLELSKQFNGHLELKKNFVVLQLSFNRRKYEIPLSGKQCFILAELFPHVEQFFTNVEFDYSSIEFNSMLEQWSPTLTSLSLCQANTEDVDNFCAQVNQMTNLKQLCFESCSNGTVNQLVPTLARLEHFSGSTITDIVHCLSNGITSFGSSYSRVTVGEITKLLELNGQFVSSLVRFNLILHDPQILKFICVHFSSLQMLHINVFYHCKFTTSMVKHLAQLNHLTELHIARSKIDLAILEVDKLAPLNNIRIFSLVDFEIVNKRNIAIYDNLAQNFDAAHFSRILSVIFPNVDKLTLISETYPEFGNLIKPHLALFANLRSFNLDYPVVRLLD